MKKNHTQTQSFKIGKTLILILIGFIAPMLKAQKHVYTDSLVGFDYKGASMHALHAHDESEKSFFTEWAKRQFIYDKYKIGPQMLKTTLVEPNQAHRAAVSQPSNCTNIDFESNNLNGWTVNGDYTIVNSGNDPFGNFPKVFPGSGNYSLRLNNNNIVNKTNFLAMASRVINVTPQNNYLNLHFALDVLNYPHQAAQAAKFIIKFLDQNNNVLACPQFQVYYAQPGGPVGINNFQQTPGSPGLNIGNQSYPVTYAPWQTIGLDLSPYNGQTITMQIQCNWCIFNYDWAYCYIDADCFGSFNPAGASCGTLPFNLCAPQGMQSYTWNSPGIPGVSSNTNCVNAVGPGIYTLNCSPFNTCGPVLLTYTFDVQPAPVAAYVFTTTPCTGSVTFQSTSNNNLGPPITNYNWIWNDLSPNGTGPNPTHVFAPGPHTVELIVTAATGCTNTAVFINTFVVTPPVTFSLINVTASNSITCLTPSINYSVVSNYTFGPLNYNWNGPSFGSTLTSVNLTTPGTYTVGAIDPATGCSMSLTFAIGINTTIPTNSVAPLSQAITCATVTPITFSGTCTNPTINLQHDWYSPLAPLPVGPPIATSGNTISILSGLIPPGVYTLQTTNLVNGCKAFKTVTITSLDAWPTFNINSTTGFSVGCSPINTTTLSITNAVSTQTPPSTCSFTFLPPGFGGTLAVGPYSGNTSTITTIPGTWTVIVNDNSNNCKTMLSVPIIQNTVAPHVVVATTAPTGNQTLTCYNPTLLATGTSSTPNTQINWLQPIAPPLVSTSTILVGPGSGPNTSTTSLTYANYTVVSTNTLNACITTSVVIISQNFKPPVSTPTISIGTPTAIFCNAGANPVVLTTGSSTTTSNGGPLAFPVPYLWNGPAPQGTATGVSSYSCYTSGVYSLTIMDNYNGCTKTGTINVVDKTQPPVLTTDTLRTVLDCGAASATLIASITGANTGLKYWYITYPSGTAFTPTAAPIPNGGNPHLSGTPSQTVMVDRTGYFQYIVTNTLTGCQARGNAYVLDGGLTADFIPDPYSGYAPLSVTFSNTSTSSLGSTSITSVWSYGNGTSETTKTNVSTSTTFTAPGTYTVMLLGSKGDCLDTVYKVIHVDSPSKLEIPNIFTPNGDGSNDVFFLKTTNLAEITAIIFDRWGNKVYETVSSTGNIAWDGKNIGGKECAVGVYFYVIKATGKDDKAYTNKGSVSLFR